MSRPADYSGYCENRRVERCGNAKHIIYSATVKVHVRSGRKGHIFRFCDNSRGYGFDILMQRKIRFVLALFSYQFPYILLEPV